MREKIKKLLEQRERKQVSTSDNFLRAAVLVPLFFQEGEYHILFTQRTDKVAFHKGQVSFPGGSYHKEDPTLLDTALRESFEEIGLKARDVEILGTLDDITTLSGFIVTPFLAIIPYPYIFRKNEMEVEKIFSVPLSVLLQKDSFQEEIQLPEGAMFVFPFYEYQGRVIWGATARILKHFLDLLKQSS